MGEVTPGSGGEPIAIIALFSVVVLTISIAKIGDCVETIARKRLR